MSRYTDILPGICRVSQTSLKSTPRGKFRCEGLNMVLPRRGRNFPPRKRFVSFSRSLGLVKIAHSDSGCRGPEPSFLKDGIPRSSPAWDFSLTAETPLTIGYTDDPHHPPFSQSTRKEWGTRITTALSIPQPNSAHVVNSLYASALSRFQQSFLRAEIYGCRAHCPRRWRSSRQSWACWLWGCHSGRLWTPGRRA
jgi:hypothetical protein